MSLRRSSRANAALPILPGNVGLLKKGAPRYDLRDPYHLAVSASWPAFSLALLAVWAAINLLFALLYSLSAGGISNAAPGSFSDAFFFSIETLATVGYGVMAPTTTYTHIVSATEIVMGMAFTAIATGLMFVRFSRPKSKILYAENPVITTFNDHHTLMIRLANGRMSVMTNANARLFALIGEHTTEGKYFRRIFDLRLMQSQIPLFVMPWTLMHVIDEASPLYGYGPEKMVAADIRLFLSVDARDQAIDTTVYDMKLYMPPDIRFGMRYAESVTLDEEGHTTADLSRLSVLEPDDAAQPEWAQWLR